MYAFPKRLIRDLRLRLEGFGPPPRPQDLLGDVRYLRLLQRLLRLAHGFRVQGSCGEEYLQLPRPSWWGAGLVAAHPHPSGPFTRRPGYGRLCTGLMV